MPEETAHWCLPCLKALVNDPSVECRAKPGSTSRRCERCGSKRQSITMLACKEDYSVAQAEADHVLACHSKWKTVGNRGKQEARKALDDAVAALKMKLRDNRPASAPSSGASTPVLDAASPAFSFRSPSRSHDMFPQMEQPNPFVRTADLGKLGQDLEQRMAGLGESLQGIRELLQHTVGQQEKQTSLLGTIADLLDQQIDQMDTAEAKET